MGESAKRLLAAEIYPPKRLFCSQIEGTQGLPLEESEYDRQKVHPKYRHQGNQGLDKLSRYL
ncbi:hypothetical protein XNA1_5110014 [Xenorhabdus nematophila str. Anatoliense]|nr:hypothetical protein XNA1_5110014 [Xenorhabdus nematophila str. Anatoliense]